VVTPLIAQLDSARVSWLPGYRVNMLDGHGLEASARRLKALREVPGGALPGTSLVVSAPAHGVVRDVFPGAAGQAQERSWCGAVLATVHADDLWRQDRNVCTCACLCAIDRRGAGCITRQPEGRPVEMVHRLRSVGRIETGHGAAPRVQGRDAQGGAHRFRRLRVQRDQATRAGDRVLDILTNVPLRQASAKRVARFDRQRWPLETAFQPLEAYGHAASTTWGYPTAALCGLCLALVADNVVAVVMAAWRSVHGAESSDPGLSRSDVANDMAHTSHGMRMAIPEDEWRVFSRMRSAVLGAPLRELAQKVRLKA
jgi:hypothetical protein